MKKLLLILALLSCANARAEDGNLELMLGAKAGVYQASGNLFADKTLRGWGLTLKLIPDDFGQASADPAMLGGIGWMLSLDIDNIVGAAHKNANFPFAQGEDIHLTWSVLAVYMCAGTHLRVQACLGLPASHSLYLEQKVAGASFNSFSMGNGNPPVFLQLLSVIKPWNFGLQSSTSYWNPTFAGHATHFNLIQAQIFAAYVF